MDNFLAWIIESCNLVLFNKYFSMRKRKGNHKNLNIVAGKKNKVLDSNRLTEVGIIRSMLLFV